MLLGRSGSGKTTTLKLINRLLVQSEGDIFVDGRSLAEWDIIRLRRMIGYVIQEVGLFPHFTVARNIGVVPQIEGWPADRIQQRVTGTAATGGTRASTHIAISARTFRRTASESRRGPCPGC